MAITIQVRSEALERDLKGLSDTLRGRVLARSVNRTATAVRTRASRLIRDEVNLRSRDVKKLISVRRAKASIPNATISIAAKAAPLIAFRGTRQSRRGVTAKPKKQRTLFRGAFIATMRSGHRGVFTRKRRSGKRVGRLPIKELFSTAAAQAIDDEAKLRELESLALQRLETEITREIRFRLSQAS